MYNRGMDIYSKKKRSQIMSKIKGKGTKLEDSGWALLHEVGMHFRKHPKGVFGNPDAGNKSKKIAIFFDSEFWHGYDWQNQKRTIKSKKKFWISKIERNMQRDKEVNAMLKKNGWRVIRIWECELHKKRQKTLSIIKKAINGYSKP